MDGSFELLTQKSGVSDWAPDGKTVYLPHRGDNDLWAVSVENRTETRLTDLSGRQGALGLGLATEKTCDFKRGRLLTRQRSNGLLRWQLEAEKGERRRSSPRRRGLTARAVIPYRLRW